MRSVVLYVPKSIFEKFYKALSKIKNSLFCRLIMSININAKWCKGKLDAHETVFSKIKFEFMWFMYFHAVTPNGLGASSIQTLSFHWICATRRILRQGKKLLSDVTPILAISISNELSSSSVYSVRSLAKITGKFRNFSHKGFFLKRS